MPNIYWKYISFDKNGDKLLHIKIAKTIYCLLQSALLFYHKLWIDLHSKGFKINPYDLCVANKVVEQTQMTLIWHINDLKFFHLSLMEVTKFLG